MGRQNLARVVASIAFLALTGATLFGCSDASHPKDLVGHWEFQNITYREVMDLYPDGSWQSHGQFNQTGAWQVDGNNLLLYRDIRNGGDVGFGDGGGDGSTHFAISDDRKTLTTTKSDSTKSVMTKVSADPAPKQKPAAPGSN